MNMRRGEVHHDQVMQEAVRQRMAVIVEQGRYGSPGASRPPENANFCTVWRACPSSSRAFPAHGHEVGTARDQDAMVRRVDLYVQRRREGKHRTLLGAREDRDEREGKEAQDTRIRDRLQVIV